MQLAATNLTKVDPRRVGVWGISYGGLNALQAVTRDPGLFAAGVSGAGIFNWVSELRYYTDTGGSTYHLDVQPPLPRASPTTTATTAVVRVVRISVTMLMIAIELDGASDQQLLEESTILAAGPLLSTARRQHFLQLLAQGRRLDGIEEVLDDLLVFNRAMLRVCSRKMLYVRTRDMMLPWHRNIVWCL